MGTNSIHRRLVRSPEGPLGGVCEGLGQRLDVNPNWLLLGWIVAALFFGTGLLLYLVLWWVLPRSDELRAEPATAINVGAPPLRRTAIDRRLLGVCGGIAYRLDLDPSAVRLAALALFTVSAGLMAVAYLLAALFIPRSSASASVPHPVEL